MMAPPLVLIPLYFIFVESQDVRSAKVVRYPVHGHLLKEDREQVIRRISRKLKKRVE